MVSPLADLSSPAGDDHARKQRQGHARDHRDAACVFPTEAFPRADSHEMILDIVARLHALPDDLAQKLTVAGFTPEPVDIDGLSQSCETCMYYLVHQRFCELPELLLPVEPEWSCRLWRI